MRNTFIQCMVEVARKNKNVAMIVGDLGYKVVEPFADEFPDRFINAGVAEQNMTGLAAGMASEGYHVFTYSIANFPTFRCAEQIRNDVAYHNLPVTIVAVGGGVAYGALGYSHHAVQDYALMRSLPNMLIAAPGDPMETRACVEYLTDLPQPSYLRLGKAGEPNFNLSPPELEAGQWNLIAAGDSRSKAILSTGAALQQAIVLKKKPDFADYSIFSMPLWSMASKKQQGNFLRKFKTIVTVEDHLHDGGFGSWLLESASLLAIDSYKIKIMALDSKVCGTVGSQSTLNKYGGI